MPANLDELTAKAVAFVEAISKRAVTAATVVLATVAAVVIATIVLGIVVLGGPVRSFFLVVALPFGTVAIGAAWIGRWRLGVSGRKLPQLTNELRELLASDSEARSAVDSLVDSAASETVVDAYVIDDDHGEVIVAERSPLAARSGSRRFGTNSARTLLHLRTIAGDGVNKFGAIAAVVGGARSYPFLAFWSLVITLGFAVIGSLLFVAYLLDVIASFTTASLGTG